MGQRELIRDFWGLGKGDAGIAGGKGASLGEMSQAGIPVPPGFVVLSGAFERFIEETDLNTEIDAALHEVNREEMHTVERASSAIQEMILAAKMPEDIAAEIKQHFAKLGAEYVAVRSSATAEDSASAAWAGQLDSFLNTTEDSLLKNVQRCWASLFTPRAIFYRFEKELHLTKISVAVVVQKMVESECSGIAFSVHPVTEDRNQLIIEAGFGLGEAIVSGQVTPDSYVVEKVPRRIIDANISTQTRALYRKSQGGENEWQEIAEPQASSQVLSPEQILELSELILKIESHYGFPCDIEWAFEVYPNAEGGRDGKFYIVQSRPITTLSEVFVEEKTSKEVYEKQYTRDTTLIIQQAWATALDMHRDGLGLFDYAQKVQVFHYLHGGVIEVWENVAWTPALMDKIYEQNVRNPELFNEYVTAHQESIRVLRERSAVGFVASVAELLPIVDAVFQTMHYFDWMYYSALDERTPAAILERATKMREADTYFDDADKCIRRSLCAIYPHLKGVEQALLRSEVANPPSREVLEERIKHFVVVGERESFLGTLEDYEQTHPDCEFRAELAPLGVSELTGQTGSKGNARGKVRILKRKEQIGEAQEGDILVSAMTTPEFVPAMKKAAAIVTDEGGIMCHAAIVARELGKPCVIGTKFATQVLHDGDLVEVDANTGVVKILERAKM